MTEREYSAEEIAALYENHTAEEISAITQWKLYQIYQTLDALGVERRPQGPRPYLQNPGIEYLHSLQEQGLSQQNMADLLEVSKRTIQRWLEEE